jgi:putative ABC transport system ATP-binding protein
VNQGEAVIEARGLTKTYRNGPTPVHALRGVDFIARSGELLVILGQSGSGKSTFLNILGGIDRPSSGEVIFRGQNIAGLGDQALTRYRRDHVGFVFQFYNLVPSLTALENVALVTEIAARPMRPEEALDIVGLSARSSHFPAQLSGGEQQRVAIARAIAKRPELLFCDEPTGALDSATGILVLEALEQANRKTGATTLIITHNAAIQQIADRTLRFADGRIVEEVTNTERKRPDQVSW